MAAVVSRQILQISVAAAADLYTLFMDNVGMLAYAMAIITKTAQL
jgi:hypothetical protein